MIYIGSRIIMNLPNLIMLLCSFETHLFLPYNNILRDNETVNINLIVYTL